MPTTESDSPDPQGCRVFSGYRVHESILREEKEPSVPGWLSSLPHGLQLFEILGLRFQHRVKAACVFLCFDVLLRQSVLLAEEHLRIIGKGGGEARKPKALRCAVVELDRVAHHPNEDPGR